MKKLLTVLLLLCLMCAPCLAEEMMELPEDWTYLGYTYGGITFPIPADTESWPVGDVELESGVAFVGGNADYTIQLRFFTPEQITWQDLADLMLEEPTAEVVFLGENEEILTYRNTRPTANSELYGIALIGLDGNLYKISIFTGEAGDCSDEAAVWEIAAFIAEHTAQMDFSQWPLNGETNS